MIVSSGARSPRWGLGRLCLIALASSLPLPTWAQQPPRDDAQRLLDEQKARAREEALTRTPAEIKSPSPGSGDVRSHPSELVETDPTFRVHQIILAGDTILSAAEQFDLLAPFVGLDLGPKRIDLLLRKLTAAYIDRGYVTTRAYLGQQNLAAGKLEITVVAGTIEQVRVDGQPGDQSAGTIWPLTVGAPLQLTDIEQTVDQINRLRSRRAEASIQPGQSVGASVVALDTHPDKPWRVSLGADNYGQSATGIDRRRIGAEVDNLMGLWDAWSVTGVESANARSELFAVSVPFGYGTASYAYAHATSRFTLLDVVNRSETASHTLGWNQVIARNQSFRHALDLTLVLRDSRRHVDDIALTPQQQTVVRLSGNTLWRGQRGSLSAELGYSRGLNEFGGDGDVPNLKSSDPHFRFEKWDANFSLAWALTQSVAWRTQLSGQTSRTGLPGSDQIYLGGAGSIRGFREGIVAGDRGYQMRNELQWTNALPGELARSGWRLDPYLFVDAGVARLLVDSADHRLVSLGLGLRAGWKGASTDLIWGHPQQAPAGIPRRDYLNFALNLQY